MNMPSPDEIRNVYVELIDSMDVIRARNLVAVFNGAGFGEFGIDKSTLSEGAYFIRAYTQYMRNFGDNFLFVKKIKITEVPDRPIETTDNQIDTNYLLQTKQAQTIDLQFLPEGGTFVSGLENNLAFIATSTMGKPINISGWIQNKSGKKNNTFYLYPWGHGKSGF